MPKSIRDQIRQEAVRIIADHPDGIRFADLQRQIHEDVIGIRDSRPSDIVKVSVNPPVA